MVDEDDRAEYRQDTQDMHNAGWRYKKGAYGGWYRTHNMEDE